MKSIVSNSAALEALGWESTVLDDGSTLADLPSETVFLALSPTTGTLSGTISKAPSAGIATFSDISISPAGSYTLDAFSEHTVPVSSATVTISAGAGKVLVFDTAPANTALGATFGAVVNAYDATGTDLASGFTGNVVLTLISTTGSATLSGTSTQPATAGVASFAGLSIATLGTYQLTATAAGLKTAVSASFQITAPASPDQLVISAPSTINVAEPFSVTVSVYYSSLNPAAGPYNIILSKDSGGGAVSGDPVTVATVGGVATFSNLVYSAAGALVLKAQCSDCPTPFNQLSSSITANNAGSTLVVTLTRTIVNEGDSLTYSIHLQHVPLDTVTVTAASASTGVTLTGSPLSFTTGNYNVDQTITVNVANTAVSGSDTSAALTITHTATSVNDPTFGANAKFSGCDALTASGTLTLHAVTSATVPQILVYEADTPTAGKSFTYHVVATAGPSSGTVDLTPAASITGVTFSPASLNISNGTYNNIREIDVVIPAGLTSALGYVVIYITHTITANGGASATEWQLIPAVLVATVFTSTPTSGVLQSAFPVFSEGTGTYTLELLSKPTSAVTISLSVSPDVLSVSPTSFTFTSADYNTQQTVTMTTRSTTVSRGKVYSTTITHAVTSLDPSYNGSPYFTRRQALPVYIINPCLSGEYTNPPGSGTCAACPAGYYCPQPHGDKVRCASGYYSGASKLRCLPCPPGFQCSDPSISPTACAAGTYSTGAATSCTTCEAGKACPAQSESVPCALGTYASAGSGSCSECPEGKYCFSTTTASSCAAGYMSVKGSPRCMKCPPGFSCAGGLFSALTPCAAGTFSPGGASSCTSCPEGHRCSPFDDLGVCPEGYYSTAGLGNCVICPGGFACTGGLKSACNYSKIGDNACRNCPPGYECTNGLDPVPCAPGLTNAGGASTTCAACASGQYADGACLPCPAGMYCQGPAVPLQCPFGTFSAGGLATCSSCTDGYMCIYGSIVAAPADSSCPMGFYCKSSGVAGAPVLPIPCPKDKENPALGKTVVGDCVTCANGFECEVGTAYKETAACPPGSYCQNGAAIQCPAGTYNQYWGKTLPAHCINVPAGYYSPLGSSYPFKCPEGNYCAGSLGAPVQCAAGTFNPTILASSTASCLTCPKGYYCLAGSASPTPCAPGTYNAATGKGASIDCLQTAAGYASPLMATVEDQFMPCSPGYFCPIGTGFPDDTANACPAGKWNNNYQKSASSDCTNCPVGWSCPKTGSANSRIPPSNCSIGRYCPAGTSTPQQCTAGTYTNKVYLEQASECSDCPPGSFCAAGASYPKPCRGGYYCPAKTATENASACPVGTYSSSNSITHSSECLACPKGHYCVLASTFPVRCVAGKYNPNYGGTAATSCLTCPAGYFCLAATVTPIACGKGYYSATGQTSQAGCIQCPAGKYCPDEATTDTAKDANLCTAGLYCPAGTDHIPTNLLDRCPSGKYCVEGTPAPVDCSAGTMRTLPGAGSAAECENVYGGYFGSTTGQSAPTGECSPGYYCPPGSTSSTQNSCPVKTFRSLPRGSAVTDCAACPAGFTCGLHTVTPVACTVGNYCPESSDTPTPCPIGTYNPETQRTVVDDCLPCLPGKYCATTGLSTYTNPCAAGYYCKEGATTATPSVASQGGVCPAGGYCPAGSVNPTNCPVGTYNPLTGKSLSTDCIACPAGQYCAGINSVDPTKPTGDCIAGFYCTGSASTETQNTADEGYYTGPKASSQIACDPGTYNPMKAQSACLDCPAGFYCDVNAMTAPKICPAGKYCEAKATTPQNCPVGTYMPNQGAMSAADCYLCDLGKACTTAPLTAAGAACNAGYWCRSGAISVTPATVADQYGSCPAGSYCPSGTSYPILCPPGSFNSATGKSISTDCTACTAGSYCLTYGLTGITGGCSAGYFCAAGSIQSMTTATICPAGSYCAAGVSASTSCLAGTYQPSAGQTSCVSCPAGFYCPTGATDYITKACSAGHYCLGSETTATPNACPAGTYNPNAGSMSASACIPCDPGKYCSGTGKSAPTGSCSGGWICKGSATQSQPAAPVEGNQCTVGTYCPIGSNLALKCDGGKYCATNGLAAPTGDCTAGYYCIYNSDVANPTDGVKGNACLAGYYCEAGSVSQLPCPSGKYSTTPTATSSAVCLNCQAGKYCQNAAMTTFSGSCSAGWFCVAGSTQSRPAAGGCPAGSMCASGVAVDTPCAAGTYQSMTLQSSCTACPAGYFCDGSSPTAPVECPTGSYCLSGTTSSTQYQCPIGTYQPVTGMVSSAACLPCPKGKYCAAPGRDTPNGPCSAGYYCTGSAQSATPNVAGQGFICPVGSICAQGSSVPQLCPPGKYCSVTGLSTEEGTCAPGYVCILGSTSASPAVTSATGGPCPAGHYCPGGSSSATPCPLGKYNPDPLKSTNAACVDCTAGFYCAQPGASAVTGPCAPGYYCPAGQITDKPSTTLCPDGKYCEGSTGPGLPGNVTPVDCPAGTYNDLKGQTVCFSCPPGFKCEGASADPVRCDAGYYCTGGNSDATKVKCAAGTFNPYTGRSACVACPLGFYCPLGSINPIICTQAGYCPAGSAAPTLCSSGLWTDLAGMQSAVQCKPCPAGQYCLNGVKVANCQAGYYCSAANYRIDPSGKLTGTAVGYPCPVGHYCLVGSELPTPCPYGKFTAGEGANNVSLCKSCTAGYYCIPGDPTPYPCPIGAYCPTGSRTPTNCPALTYSLSTMAKDTTTCQACPAGYLCTDSGIGDYKSRPCSPGYFCPSQTTALQPCTEGTWSIVHNSPSCAPCPTGFMCGAKAMTATPCPRGKYCPIGTGVIPQECPAGFFCEYAAQLAICPGGYYCPKTNSTLTELPPLRCPLGYYCPIGSSAPVKCPSGTVYTKYSLRLNPAEACVSCGPGLYSKGDVLQCQNCSPGYACPNGASRPDPQSMEEDGGYPCPAGFYCPEGTGDPLPCPRGTYNPNTHGSSISQCRPCAANTYSELEGQAGCFPCGANAYSSEGQATCQCYGASRTYMKRDGTCRCKPGYVFYKDGATESDEDSRTDCVELVRNLCDSGKVRAPDGSCKSRGDCAAECNGGVGERKPDLGICLCKDIASLDDVCNSRCRSSSPTVSLRSDGKFELKYPNRPLTEVLDFQSTPGYLGRVTCFSDLSCNVTTANVTDDGVFTSQYTPTVFTEYASSLRPSATSKPKRELATVGGLQNPVYCLQLGQTMVFSITSQQHYPVYLKDSLLNTNSDFDFSPFLELQNFIKNGGTPVSNFAYTFVDPGKYVFADAEDESNMIVVSVMERGASCSQETVRERSESTMTRVGVVVGDTPNTETEWAKFGFLLGTSMLLLVTVVGIYVFRKRKFIAKLQPLKLRKVDPETGLIQRTVDDVLSAEIGVHNRLLEIDPAFFQVIYDKLIDNFHILAARLKDRSAEEQAKMTAMLDALRKVRDAVTDTRRTETPAVTQRAERGDRRTSLFGPAASEANRDKEEMAERIQKDSRLEDEEKQALLKELEEDMNRLDAQLAENRATGENNLRKRLEEKARRKKDLMRRREELAGEENQVTADMQKLLKDADAFNREADRDYEKERRKARETVIGPDAVALRKELEQRIRDSPGREDELIAEFDRQMDRLEARMDADKKRQLEDTLRRADERRAARRKKAMEKGKAANDLQAQADRIKGEIKQVDDQLDLLERMNETTNPEPGKTDGEDLTQQEEENVRKQFLMRQRDLDKEYHAKMDDLQRQKQRLVQTLATPDFEQDKQRLQADLERAEETLDRLKKEQIDKQRQLLEQRLLERKRRRDRKRAELQDEGADRTEMLARQSEQKLVQLSDILRQLPVSERAEAARKLLAEKHDAEVVEIERHQQEEAAKEYRLHIKRVMDAKVAATKALPEHLSSLSEAEQKANFNQLMMGVQSELQEDLQRRMRELQDQATKEMEALTARHSRELHDLLKSLEAEVPREDLYRLEADFDKRRVELEDENARRLEALQKQNEELVARLKQKKEQLNEAVMQAQQLQEIEHAKRVLEDKHRREREALERAENLTHEQVEILMARHRQEIEQLEQTLHEEQAKHKEQLAARLAAKRSKKQKLLDLPEDLKSMAPTTAQLVTSWRKAHHQALVEVDDPMLELLRRVERIEQIVQNVEQVQFEQLQKAFDSVLALQPKS